MRANTFGFYSVNEKSVVNFKENSKKESVCEFLEKIRNKSGQNNSNNFGQLQITLGQKDKEKSKETEHDSYLPSSLLSRLESD